LQQLLQEADADLAAHAFRAQQLRTAQQLHEDRALEVCPEIARLAAALDAARAEADILTRDLEYRRVIFQSERDARGRERAGLDHELGFAEKHASKERLRLKTLLCGQHHLEEDLAFQRRFLSGLGCW